MVVKTMTFEIEHNVPVPSGRGRPGKYPWRQMGLGDSFVIPNCTDGARSGLYGSAGRAGIKIKYAREGKNVRVWRVA